MQCGAKCFVVHFEKKGMEKTKRVIARTPIAVRKVIRRHYGDECRIIQVKRVGINGEM